MYSPTWHDRWFDWLETWRFERLATIVAIVSFFIFLPLVILEANSTAIMFTAVITTTFCTILWLFGVI